MPLLMQWKSISITQPEFVCVFVALGILHAMSMNNIVICGQSRSTNISPHYLTKGTILEKTATEHKLCVLIFSTTFA